jgi:hypothetical protein
MAVQGVATKADAQIQVGTTPPSNADAGVWAPKAPIDVKTDPKITIGGAAAIYEASCTFTFTGTKSGAAVPPTDDTVTLTASPTKLQTQRHVLRNGDSKASQYGNTVKIVAAPARKLESG